MYVVNTSGAYSGGCTTYIVAAVASGACQALDAYMQSQGIEDFFLDHRSDIICLVSSR